MSSLALCQFLICQRGSKHRWLKALCSTAKAEHNAKALAKQYNPAASVTVCHNVRVSAIGRMMPSSSNAVLQELSKPVLPGKGPNTCCVTTSKVHLIKMITDTEFYGDTIVNVANVSKKM